MSVCARGCRNGNTISPRPSSVDIQDVRLGVGFHGSRPVENGHASVSQVRVHPRFNATDRSYDIALVRLSSPLNFGDQLRPVCLPGSSSEVFGNLTRCVVTGLAYTPLSGIIWDLWAYLDTWKCNSRNILLGVSLYFVFS